MAIKGKVKYSFYYDGFNDWAIVKKNGIGSWDGNLYERSKDSNPDPKAPQLMVIIFPDSGGMIMTSPSDLTNV